MARYSSRPHRLAQHQESNYSEGRKEERRHPRLFNKKPPFPLTTSSSKLLVHVSLLFLCVLAKVGTSCGRVVHDSERRGMAGKGWFGTLVRRKMFVEFNELAAGDERRW